MSFPRFAALVGAVILAAGATIALAFGLGLPMAALALPALLAALLLRRSA